MGGRGGGEELKRVRLTWNAWWSFQVFAVEMLYDYFTFLCGLHPVTQTKEETEFKKIDFQKDQTFQNMTRVIWQCSGAQYMYTYIVKIDVTFNDFFQEVQLKFVFSCQ